MHSVLKMKTIGARSKIVCTIGPASKTKETLIQMIDAGMDEDKAFELTQKFMDSSSPGGMISKVLGEVGGDSGINFGGGGGHSHDDIGDEIEKKIKIKIAKKFEDEDE